jgi:hypothetical protein
VSHPGSPSSTKPPNSVKMPHREPTKSNNNGGSIKVLFTEFDGFVEGELPACETKCCLLFEMSRRYNLL